MQTLRISFFIVCSWFCLAAPAQVTSILFLGNSYTAVNNLPDLVYQLALSGGDTVQYASNTPGGYTLQLHSQDATTISMINQQAWDYVVIQCQSQEPSLDSAYVTNNVFPYAHLLDSMIETNNACTQTVFYMTWGRKYGDASNCSAYPPVCTYSGMQDELRRRYVQMAVDNGTQVSPVGACWQNAIAAGFFPDLYQADYSHPSIYGSYLAACSFYATIFRRSPVGLTYYAGLPQAEAAFLQSIAESTVLDSLGSWNSFVYLPDPSFTVSSGGANIVNASNTDPSVVSWQWDDGTGNGFVNGNANETFTYANGGTYTICLAVTNNCGRTDTLCQQVNTLTLGAAEHAAEPIAVFPNPSSGNFTIRGEALRTGSRILICDMQGREVFSAVLNAPELQLGLVAPGMYTVAVTNGSEILKTKLVIE